MASMTMTASFLAAKPLPTTARRNMVAVRASKNVVAAAETKEENNGRRDIMLGVAVAAAAAALSVAKVAMADEPKRGTEAAKKKYAPICVTMPTARICRN